MGIYKQPGKSECGPFALKHALLMRGVLASEREIAKLAGTNHDGTDELQLARAARRYGYRLPTIRKTEADAARDHLAGFLKQGIPCLLCVHEWDHWVTAVFEEDGQFVILDSERPEVIVVADWPQLQKHWVYHEKNGGNRGKTLTLYDLHPVIPPDPSTPRARFSVERAKYLLQPENRSLAQLWDAYVEDLVTLCRGQEPDGGEALSLAEWIGRQKSMLLEELETWHGQIDRAAAGRVLERMRFVADTYGLVIRRSDERRTISAASMILALWAAGEFGVEPLYRRVPIRKIR